ncbi:hypothetical protein Hdeb2414_s0002g00078291 [Helianthus debilis subsp. tardiflorus]
MFLCPVHITRSWKTRSVMYAFIMDVNCVLFSRYCVLSFYNDNFKALRFKFL